MIPAGFRRDKLTHWVAFGLGSGFSPKAPGTVGTLAAIPFALLLAQLPLPLHLILLLLAVLFGIYCCGRTTHDLGVHDHGAIVWDEFVGYWLAVALVPKTLFWLACGFVVFRVLDILKPWPISVADRSLDGGLGVMLDDVIAGLMTGGILLLADSVLS